MKNVTIIFILNLILYVEISGEQFKLKTRLDQYKPLFSLARQASLRSVNRSIDNIYAENLTQGKLQPRIPDSQPFPCDIRETRSLITPISVDKIRPGDIDVIACIGDSISAANGAMSTNVPHIINEFRSISFTGGGRGDWRKYLTLPNILKVFNPNLYGYAIGDGTTTNKQSRLNIAEPMLMTRDMPFQVKTLIKRMEDDPNVDMKNHWKLLTIFVGSNDICSDMCHHENLEQFLSMLEDDLIKGLILLKANVPRMIVNILTVPHMKSLYDFKNVPYMCQLLYDVGCHCIFKSQLAISQLYEYFRVITEWQNRQERISNMMELRGQDFAIVFQPFVKNISSIFLDENIDLTFFASDCFHLSQRGHALAANSLWNNMMQKKDVKQVVLYPLFQKFECPTRENPFIAV